MADDLKVSDASAIAMPIRNLISIVLAVAVGVGLGLVYRND